MDHVIRYLTTHLPGHEFSFNKRPDGKIIISLSKNGANIYMKAIEPCSLTREEDLKKLTKDLKLTQKLNNGNICREEIEKLLLQRALPTFSGNPINPTAAKMIWKKRQAPPESLVSAQPSPSRQLKRR